MDEFLISFIFFTVYFFIYSLLIRKGIIITKHSTIHISDKEKKIFKEYLISLSNNLFFGMLFLLIVMGLPNLINLPLLYIKYKYLESILILIILIIIIINMRISFKKFKLKKKELLVEDKNSYQEIFPNKEELINNYEASIKEIIKGAKLTMIIFIIDIILYVMGIAKEIFYSILYLVILLFLGLLIAYFRYFIPLKKLKK
jgi:hypothetical protein